MAVPDVNTKEIREFRAAGGCALVVVTKNRAAGPDRGRAGRPIGICPGARIRPAGPRR